MKTQESQNHWTDAEDQFIKDNYQSMLARNMALVLGKTAPQINHRIYQLGLRGAPQTFDSNRREKMRDAYIKYRFLHYRIPALAKEMGMNFSSFEHSIKEYEQHLHDDPKKINELKEEFIKKYHRKFHFNKLAEITGLNKTYISSIIRRSGSRNSYTENRYDRDRKYPSQYKNSHYQQPQENFNRRTNYYRQPREVRREGSITYHYTKNFSRPKVVETAPSSESLITEQPSLDKKIVRSSEPVVIQTPEKKIAKEQPQEKVTVASAWSMEKLGKEITLLMEKGVDLKKAESRPGSDEWNLSVEKHYGNWDKLIATIEKPVKKRMKRSHWTRENILEAIRELQKTLGDVSPSRSREKNGGLYCASYKIFGSWSKAVDAAQVDYSDYKKANWSEKKIKDTILLMNRQGMDLNSKAVISSNLPLYNAGKRYFDSWGNALKAAGFDESKIQKQISWSKERIIKDIKTLHQKGVALNYSSIVKTNDKLVRAAMRYFDNWSLALTASGFEPNEVRLRKIKKT